MGIKQIIVITDNAVCKQTHVQTHFEGADLVLLCIFLHILPAETLFVSQQIIDGLVDSVVMPPGIRAIFRITLCLLHKTGFFLSG